MNAPAGTPYLRAGVVTALGSSILTTGLGALLALLAGGTGPLDALRTGAVAWLVAQGSGLEVGGAGIGLLPVGGMLLVGAVTALVASRVLDEPLDGPGPFAATVAGTSGVLAAVAASIVGVGSTVAVGSARAAVAAFVVAGVGAALGATVTHGRADQLWPSDHPVAREVLRAAARGTLALLASAAGVVLALLTWRLARAADLWAALDPGLGGGLTLAVVCLLSVPTLVLWATSVLIGPGFVLGTGTSVDLAGAQLGPVPGLPVLGALPPPGDFGSWVVALGLAPLLAGVWAGWTTRPPVDRGPWHRVGLGAAAGAVAGLACGVLVGLSGGSLGPGRMADVGPPALWPVLVAVPVLAVGGALGALLSHYRGTRAQQPADARARRRPRLRLRHQPPGADRRDH